MQQRNSPASQQTYARRRDRNINSSMNGKRGRCYLPEESEESPEAHPPARTSTRVVTGASEKENYGSIAPLRSSIPDPLQFVPAIPSRARTHSAKLVY